MNEEKNPYASNKQPDKNGDMKIAGYNLGAMLIYGLILVGIMGQNGLMAFGFLYLAHAFICILTAIVQRKWVWFLSSILIVIIGFSTCANFMG
ncbi:MAG TPA: hypothetical protein VNW51_04195 [Mucilaginibacter sp.]|jgi:hypothetical protein|nr:hypothetical protein [Mucilaginibacter sp.]